MRRSAIEWCDHTLNAVSGCLNNCPYCYARTMVRRFSGDERFNVTKTERFTSYPAGDNYKGHRLYELEEPFIGENGEKVAYPFGFEPTFHRYRLEMLNTLQGGSNIFVGAMSDMFGPWVPERWITEVLEKCQEHDKNNYMFLTKFPERYRNLSPILPTGERFWYGTTITRNEDLWRLDELPEKARVFLSIEPLLQNLLIPPEDFRSVGWIIIGAETGRRRGKVVPEFEWVRRLVLSADNFGIPVLMKESMVPIVGEKNMRRDCPDIMKDKPLGERRERQMFGNCFECGKRYRRNEMVTLQARVGRRDKDNPLPTKTICAMCRSCYEKWCKYHKLEGYVEELYGNKEVSDEEA